MAELIFEIGCEEIPAGFIRPALKTMSDMLVSALKSRNLEHDGIETHGAPRRLMLIVRNLPEKQEDREETVTGPKAGICFDDEGNPTKVALGFAKSHGVEVADLKTVEGPKGPVVQASKRVKGMKTKDILSEILLDILKKPLFPKSMRWASHSESFVRPLHWIVAVLDGSLIPFEFAGVKSGDVSYGHYFMHPGPIEVRVVEQFIRQLHEAFVIPDIDERKEYILTRARKLVEEVNGKLVEDEDLLEEVANLVEYPLVLLGTFDEEFLKVPKPILVDSMNTHQKYFSVSDGEGHLMPYFIMVANTRVNDPSVVVRGNERVLRARLADARFFFEEDRKKRLAEFADGLKKVTFEEKLGSLAEKVERILEHIRYLSPFISAEALEPALKAALLAKADLLTGVVGEFPDLQGIIGRIYASLDGEDKLVSDAIEQHYRPRFSGDALPESDVAAMLALADKLDTVTGCFGVGLIPTGTADPYALRRQALGIVRILVHRRYRVPLKNWIEFAVGALGEKLVRSHEETVRDVIAFIEGRYRNWRSGKYPNDVIEAVAGASFDILPDTEEKIKALMEFQKKPGFQALAVAFKRVMNILKERPDVAVNPDLFEYEAEKELWKVYQHVRDESGAIIRKGNFPTVLETMAEVKEPVDRFFDDCLVMTDDRALRENRLALLGHLADLFAQMADFRKIQTD